MIAQINYQYSKLSLKKSYTRLLSYIFYEGRPLTTKGRWINPLVSSLYRLQESIPFSKPIIKPIFIIGTGRSGTTILGITLSIHNDVGFLNEPKALWSHLYDEEDLIGSYQEKEGRYRLTAADNNAQLVTKAHRILGNYLRFGFASRVVDKYPELIFRVEFVRAIFPDARFLFLYRNGHDTCHSIQLWSKRLGKEKNDVNHDWWGRDDRKWNLLCTQLVAADKELGPYITEINKYTNHSDRAAVEWIITMKEGMRLLAQHSDYIMGVKYEDYISSAKTRQNVLCFCDLKADATFDTFCKNTLKAPKPKPKINYAPAIQDEFVRIMQLLDYE